MAQVNADRDLVVILASHYDVRARRQVVDAGGRVSDVGVSDDVEQLQAALPLNVRVRTIVRWVDSAPQLSAEQLAVVKQIMKRTLARRRATITGGMGLSPPGIVSPSMWQTPAEVVLRGVERLVEKAAVVVLLLGTAFLVSPGGQDSVLMPVLANAAEQGVVVLPVLLDESANASGLVVRFAAFGASNRPVHLLMREEQTRFWGDLAETVSRAAVSAPGATEIDTSTAAPASRLESSLRCGTFGRVLGLSWSPNGDRIAAACEDSLVYIWAADTAKRLLIYAHHAAQVNAVAWSPDGTRLASVSRGAGNVQVWEAATGKRLLAISGHVDAEAVEIVWLPDGRRLTGGQVVGQATSVAWSPDGARLVTGGDDRTAQVWNARSGERLLTYAGHADPINAVAWSPDGSRIASGGGLIFGDVTDPWIHVWDAQNGDHLLSYTGHEGAVLSITWSPDGTRIASSQDGRVAQVWDATTATLLQTYSGHSWAIRVVRWSPDGTRIASCGDDGTVQVWDPTSGEQVAIYRGHTGPYKGLTGGVFAVAWSPDGRRIASGDERTVHIWTP